METSTPRIEGYAYHRQELRELRRLAVAALLGWVLVAFPHVKGSKEEQRMTARRGLPRKCTAHRHHRVPEGNQSQTCHLDLPRQLFLLGGCRGHHHHMR